MKIIYLLSGPLALQGFSNEIINELKEDLKDKTSISFIASSPKSYDKNDLYIYGNGNDVVGLKNHLKQVMNIENLKIIDERTSYDEAKDSILESDVVYLLGGNPFTQLDYIKNKGYDKVLNKYNGIILGTSAGAMNLAKYAYYSQDEDYPKSIFYDGLGIVDITVDPHFEIENNEQVKEAEVFSKEHIIIGLPDSSAVRIEDKQVEYIGKCYIFENGVMTTLNDKYEKNK